MSLRFVGSIAAVGLAVAACASSEPAGAPAHGSAPSLDTRLVGTWRAEQARYRGAVTNADAETYEYLVLTRRGTATLYDGDAVEPYRWSTRGDQLLLQQPDGVYSDATALRSPTAARISTAVDYLTSSPRINYALSSEDKITLSGTARFYKGNLAHPSASGTSPPRAVTATLTYARVAGPPPPVTAEEPVPTTGSPAAR